MPPTRRLSVRCVGEYSGWFLEGIRLWQSSTLLQSAFTRTRQILACLSCCELASSLWILIADHSDDEYLTAEGPLAQPRDHQVVMAGFHYISKIFMRECPKRLEAHEQLQAESSNSAVVIDDTHPLAQRYKLGLPRLKPYTSRFCGSWMIVHLH
jgi:hypothetical protein